MDSVPQDAQTLTAARRALENTGYTGQFKVLEFVRVQARGTLVLQPRRTRIRMTVSPGNERT
jgi:hypothetical protein